MRIERKFVFENQLQSDNIFQNILKNFVIKKIFESRQINSVYLDTKKLDYLHDNLSGIKNRIKSRIRFYSDNNTQIIYEEKIKKNEIGFKKKTVLKTDGKINLNFENSIKIFKESNFFLKSKYFLKETLFVQYNRKYFIDIFGNFITYDTDICFSDVEYFKKPIMYKKAVIEYKIFENNFKNNLFYNFKQRYSRHSKYVAGMAILNKTSYV